jgi:hypothetical protein
MSTIRHWEAVRDELEALAAQHDDRLTPELVVETARRHPGSALHQCFTWDVEHAAYERWIDQARELIRRVRVEIQTEERTYTVSAYLRDPGVEPSKQGYVSIRVLQREPEQARLTILHEFAMAESYLQRARDLAAALQVAKATDRALAAVADAKAVVTDNGGAVG